MTLAKDIARDLLDIKAVYLKPEEPLLGHLALNHPFTQTIASRFLILKHVL